MKIHFCHSFTQSVSQSVIRSVTHLMQFDRFGEELPGRTRRFGFVKRKEKKLKRTGQTTLGRSFRVDGELRTDGWLFYFQVLYCRWQFFSFRYFSSVFSSLLVFLRELFKRFPTAMMQIFLSIYSVFLFRFCSNNVGKHSVFTKLNFENKNKNCGCVAKSCG